MSYDIELRDPKTREVIQFDKPHQERGGTYALGGTSEAWLNVTYNYSKHFYRTMGREGIRRLYGLTGKQAIGILEKAISKLGGDVSGNYWEATEGNAKEALKSLLVFAKLRPDGIFDGD